VSQAVDDAENDKQKPEAKIPERQYPKQEQLLPNFDFLQAFQSLINSLKKNIVKLNELFQIVKDV